MNRPKMKYLRDLENIKQIKAKPTDTATRWLLERVADYENKYRMPAVKAFSNVLGNAMRETFELKRWFALNECARGLDLIK